ncbi:hypothetical protein L596_004104 [Steinernema carpocapsae]|uniref:Uncharacterized protein n=1 Tax=Steinernema carpocapsae TaxID=34508 RepID=A0A4U8UUR4_STECR|nr:hypothetical protein L596_004104 [Steinernema carpocapsae]
MQSFHGSHLCVESVGELDHSFGRREDVLSQRSRVGLHRGLGHRLPSAQCASEKRALRDSEQDCPDQTPSVRNGHHFVRGSHGLDRRPDLLPTL